jgi:hypothetical protein
MSLLVPPIVGIVLASSLLIVPYLVEGVINPSELNMIRRQSGDRTVPMAIGDSEVSLRRRLISLRQH